MHHDKVQKLIKLFTVNPNKWNDQIVGHYEGVVENGAIFYRFVKYRWNNWELDYLGQSKFYR